VVQSHFLWCKGVFQIVANPSHEWQPLHSVFTAQDCFRLCSSQSQSYQNFAELKNCRMCLIKRNFVSCFFVTKRVQKTRFRRFLCEKSWKNFYFALFLSGITRWIFDSIRVFAKKTGVFLCCITSFGSVFG
jgi:hypothetical protein